MRYIDKLKTLPPDDPTNPLIIGLGLHKGVEMTVEQGIEEYFMSYPIITDRHIEEAMKLEVIVPKVKAMIPEGEHEVMISNKDFIGFIDLVSKNDDGTYDIYDFKYSNNVQNYRKSPQMHLYKYFWEKQNPGKEVKHLYYLFAPKTGIRQKKTESLFEFRDRLTHDLSTMEPKLIEIEYDQSKIIEFLIDAKRLLEADSFPLYEDYLWKFSEYYNYITKGEDYMLLPENKRRDITKVEKKTVWVYGSPFSGKTTFANNFPDPLMLNTDGNVQFVDAPFIAIKDTVVTEGRRTVRTFAWQNFKDTVDELEKKDNDFKTIIVDLIEDTYESCRLYMYDKLGISHESDDSFRAWDKVRTEFLSTFRKLMNLDYENIILISHEDTSKDITKKSGDKITAIKPNLQEKTANKLAGMVHMVARVIVEEDDTRTLSFKQNEVTFGGGRLSTNVTEIPLDYGEFLTVYEEANASAASKVNKRKVAEPKEEVPTEDDAEKPKKRGRKKKEETVEPIEQNVEPVEPSKEDETETEVEETAKPRARKHKEVEPVEDDAEEESAEENTEEVEEKPKTRTRSRKKAEPVEETEEKTEEKTEEPVVEAPKKRTRKKRD